MSTEVTASVTEPQVPRVIYDTMKELVGEWQATKDERAIWDYLGMPEYVFKEWFKKCRDGVNDA